MNGVVGLNLKKEKIGKNNIYNLIGLEMNRSLNE